MDKLKRKYFLLHLTTSFFVILSICFICQYIWFPAPFLLLDGTWQALLILAFVDIILGPLLTFILVTSNKPSRELLFDVIIILLLQLTALSYGLMQISHERLYALILLDGAFNPVPIKEIASNNQLPSIKLPQYKGIYYGMAEYSLDLNDKPLLYSPEKYKKLTKETVSQNKFIYEKLPLSVKQRFNSDYFFKVLPGKNGVAVVIIDENLKIVDIVLLH